MNALLNFEAVEQQIREKRKTVGYDIKEFTIEYLVDKFNRKEIYVPEYQREFIWDIDRQSKLIESIILGLPIPYIYIADVRADDKEGEDEGNLEIVDGVQRLSTLQAFMNSEFKLQNLTELTMLNGLKYSDFSDTRKRRFYNTTLRMIFISEESDSEVRFMMFERINTGSEKLTSIEQRKGIYKSDFMDFVYECAKNPIFGNLTYFRPKIKSRREAEELIFRFFAYSEKYEEYDGNANSFLDEYAKNKVTHFDKEALHNRFEAMLQFVEKHFKHGFLKTPNSQKTPRMRFEAISVGVHLALAEKPSLQQAESIDTSWTESEDFITQVSGSNTSSKSRLLERINFVKNKLVTQHV